MLAVTAKNSKIAISEMFTAELKFSTDCLLKRFNKKFGLNRKYKIEHPIDWSQDRCFICTFLLKINPNRMMQTRKQCSTLILLFSRNINF